MAEQCKHKIRKLRTKWSKKREKLGQSGAAGGDAAPIFDIIDSVESNKELTNPTFLGDSLDDYDDDDSIYDDPSMTSQSDHGTNSSTDTASKLQTHFSLYSSFL